jgi:adenylate cyclase
MAVGRRTSHFMTSIAQPRRELQLTRYNRVTLTHELRSTLSNVVGYVELLLEGGEPGTQCDLTGADSKATDSAINVSLRQMLEVLRNASDAVNTPSLDLTLLLHRLDATATQCAHEMSALVRTLHTPGGNIPAGFRADVDRIVHAINHLRCLTAHEPSATSQQLEERSDGHRIDLACSTPPDPHMSRSAYRILIVGDDLHNQTNLLRCLEAEGHSCHTAENPNSALESLSSAEWDLVVIDQHMPREKRVMILRHIRSRGRPTNLPVIIISTPTEVDDIIECLESGADEYIAKPVNQKLFAMRVKTLVDRRRVSAQQMVGSSELARTIRELENQKHLSEELLRNILPQTAASELQHKGFVEPTYYEDATIGFVDIVGFTEAAETLSAEELVDTLHDYFTAFDIVVERYGLEKLKTIGDAYMFVGGMPVRNSTHPIDAILAASSIVEVVESKAGRETGPNWKIRIGMHTGPVIAGVVGIRKFAFDIWGESVNISARLQGAGSANRINVSDRTYTRIKDFFTCSHRGLTRIKGDRIIDMYFVDGILPALQTSTFVADAPEGFRRRYESYFRKSLPAFPERWKQIVVNPA